MCILLNVKKHEKTFALNVDIFIHGNILPLLWTFTPEFGTILVVSLYTNEEILCTGRIKTIG